MTRHKEPLYLVSNSLRNTNISTADAECFRDIKTLFGRQLRLKRQELPRVALLWFLVCVSYATVSYILKNLLSGGYAPIIRVQQKLIPSSL